MRNSTPTYSDYESIYDLAFINRMSPARYNKLEKWIFKKFKTGGKKLQNIQEIISLLHKGYDVKCCYMTTSIRGYHTHYIFYKI